MVTAETALSLPAVILVLLMVLAAVSAGVTQLRVADAARTAARPVPGPLGGLGLTARARACTYTEPSSP